jgi:hypothetical protein
MQYLESTIGLRPFRAYRREYVSHTGRCHCANDVTLSELFKKMLIAVSKKGIILHTVKQHVIENWKYFPFSFKDRTFVNVI